MINHLTITSDMVLINSEIRNNSAYDFGGGINIRVNSTARLENVLVKNNEVSGGAHSKGGGVHIDESSGIIISDCEIVGNNANKWGGGLAFGTGARVTILNTTVAYNSALNGGGGIYFNYDDIAVNIGNVISYNNTPQEIYFDDICYNDTVTMFYSDIAGGVQGIYNSGFNVVQWLEDNITAYPQFIDPGSGDYTLFETSPCIDAGTDLFVHNGDTLINMQPDGYIGPAPDMGCHEYDPLIEIVEKNIFNGEQQFILFPNPAINSLNVHLASMEQPVSFTLVNANGQILINRILKNELSQIDISGFTNGVYLIRLDNQNFSLVKKVIFSD
jgi:predicted outer membrane repeat protein